MNLLSKWAREYNKNNNPVYEWAVYKLTKGDTLQNIREISEYYIGTSGAKPEVKAVYKDIIADIDGELNP